MTLVREFGATNVEAIPNAVALPPETAPAREPTLLLLGTYAYDPNRVGAEFFLDQVWPEIKAAMPDARLTVAGTGSEAIRHYRNRPPTAWSLPVMWKIWIRHTLGPELSSAQFFRAAAPE